MESNNSAKWISLSLFIVLAAVGAVWYLWPSYGTVSGHGYDYSMALYSACNQKNPAKIAEIQQMISDDDELSDDEQRWLGDIIQLAEAGQWKRAATKVRSLMDAQVRPTNPLPDLD